MAISKKSIFSILVIATAYIVIVTYLRNFVLVNDSFLTFGLVAKIRLYISLLIGMTTSMTPLAVLLMLITSVLTGINITLIRDKIMDLKKIRKVHFLAGGSSILGVIGGGCVACGLPVISVLGLSGSLVFLPFKGAELPYVSIFLLLLSLYFLIKSNTNEVCEVK